MYRRPDLEIHDEVVYTVEPRLDVMALAEKIAFALGKQSNIGEVGNLGDGESVIFMDKLPVFNIVQLAEDLIEVIDNIKRDHAVEVLKLRYEIEQLQYDAMGEDL